VNPSRTIARITADRLVVSRARFTNSLVNSSNVASFDSLTMRHSSSDTRPWIGDSMPPPRAERSTLPVSRCRRSTRLTLATLTQSSAAISSYS
jgi:hypothetical protein